MAHRRPLRLAIGCVALGLFVAGHVKADPSPSLLKTSQPATCTSTPSILVPAQPGANQMVTIEQLSTTAFYLGNSTVTTSTGFPIPGTANASYTLSTSADIWCVTASGTASVAVIQPIGR